VNDAFGTAHRAHGSTAGVTKFLSPSVSGLLLQKELDYLSGAVSDVDSWIIEYNSIVHLHLYLCTCGMDYSPILGLYSTIQNCNLDCIISYICTYICVCVYVL